jgi:hypothetical protein
MRSSALLVLMPNKRVKPNADHVLPVIHALIKVLTYTLFHFLAQMVSTRQADLTSALTAPREWSAHGIQ